MIVRRAEELSVEEVMARREMVVAVADGEINAAALLADFLIAGADAYLALNGARTSGPQSADLRSGDRSHDQSPDQRSDDGGPEVRAPAPALLGALVWRIGAKALRLYALGCTILDGAADGVIDALVPLGTDSVEWAAGWIGRRSELALDAAAALIRRRGGDDLERAEFARLFAIGEPQEGLAAWLESKSTKRQA